MVSSWEHDVCLKFLESKLPIGVLPTQLPNYSPQPQNVSGSQYQANRPDNTHNRHLKVKLLELGNALFGPGPDTNWDADRPLGEYEKFQQYQTEEDKSNKYNYNS